MAFPNRLFSYSTWRIIGLGFSTTCFVLGAVSIVNPLAAAGSLGVTPTTPEGLEINKKEMIFLGIRDVAVAGALFWFSHERKEKEMGVLLTSWVLVCVVDTWVATKGPKGWDSGIWTLCGGATACAFVAAGLLQT